MARILLIDDEPNIRFLYSEVLADNGHDVREAKSGREAMQLIQREPLDLIVLDIKLGSESGLDVLQEIVHFYPRLPVIILTAYASFQDDYTSWLARDYVVKSTDPSEFLRAIDHTLDQTEQRVAPEQIYQASMRAQHGMRERREYGKSSEYTINDAIGSGAD